MSTDTIVDRISGHGDVDPEDPYQLMIIVKDTKNWTTIQLARAISRSVAQFAPLPSESPTPNWSKWLYGRFRKIAKRLKPSLFDSLVEKNHLYVYEDSGVELVILPPDHKSVFQNMPDLKRAQIAHFHVLENSNVDPQPEGSFVRITLNDTFPMSPPKAAVAAAHALQIARQRLNKLLKPQEYDTWMKTMPIQVVWGDANAIRNPIALINDAGLTEVVPGSTTAVAEWISK